MNAYAEIDNALKRLANRKGNPYNDLAARNVIRSLSREAIDEMALRYLQGRTSDSQRQATLAVEREAQRPAAESKRRRDKENRTQRRAEEAEAKAHGYDSAVSWSVAKVEQAFRDLKSVWRMEWTAELLDSTFALADGSRVTWGDATADQHRERVDMFRRNALANLEGAARHEQAIDALMESGAKSLRKMVNRNRKVVA